MPEQKTGNRKAWIEVFEEFCKGCGLCIVDCPKDDLEFADHLNRKGFRPMQAKGENCIGCGICFYACPEPRAIRVHKIVDEKKGEKGGSR